MPRKPMRITASTQGAGQQAKRAREIVRMIDRDMAESARNVGDDAELIYQAAAPVRTGRLKAGIRAVSVGDEVVVTARAVDPDTGFDYVAVSRFGHRKRLIVPVAKGGNARKSRTVKRGASGRFITRGLGYLRFASRGRTWVLPSVRGFRPRGDWVDRAWPSVKSAADSELEQTGNKIEVRWTT